MPSLYVGAYLADTDFTLDGIVSTRYPEGKAYRFPSPPGARGMWMRDLVQAARTAQITGQPDPRAAELVLNGAEEMDLYREVLGVTLDELLDDGVAWAAVQRIFGLLFRHYGADQDIRNELRESTTSTAADADATVTKTPAVKRPARRAVAKKTPKPPVKSVA